MATDRDNDVPEVVTEVAEALGVQKHAHGDVEQWRRRNIEDEEQGPLDQSGDHKQEDQAAEEPSSGEWDDDNLVQLPVGAKFDLDHEPSPQEREELVRFAAEADAEMGGQDGRGAQD